MMRNGGNWGDGDELGKETRMQDVSPQPFFFFWSESQIQTSRVSQCNIGHYGLFLLVDLFSV